jgi:signal transduction histidine kinase
MLFINKTPQSKIISKVLLPVIPLSAIYVTYIVIGDKSNLTDLIIFQLLPSISYAFLVCLIAYKILKASLKIMPLDDERALEFDYKLNNKVKEMTNKLSSIQEIGRQNEEAQLSKIVSLQAYDDLKEIEHCEFVNKLSVELFRGLNKILGPLEAIAKTRLTKVQAQNLDGALKEAYRIQNNQLDWKDFSTLDYSFLKVEKSNINLKKIIDGSIIKNEKNALSKSVYFNHFYSGFAWDKLMIADPIRVRQLINILLENAVKNTAKGGVTVRSGLKQVNEKQMMFSLIVSDTGEGINSELLDEINETFQQAGVEREYTGIGRNLETADKLVHLMGGKISVKSSLNTGSTFSILIPLEISYGLKEVSNIIRRPTVLICDKKDSISEIFMRQKGVEANIIDSEDVEDYRDYLVNYDLVFIDLSSEKNIEFARDLRSNFPHTTMIEIVDKLTGFQTNLHVELQVIDVIKRPLRKKVLVDIIMEQISLKDSINKVISKTKNREELNVS